MSELATVEIAPPTVGATYLPIRGALYETLSVLRALSNMHGCPLYPAAVNDALRDVIMTEPLPVGLTPLGVRDQLLAAVQSRVDLDHAVRGVLPSVCRGGHGPAELVGHEVACLDPIWCITAAILASYVPATRTPAHLYAKTISAALGSDLDRTDVLVTVVPPLFDVEHAQYAGALRADHLARVAGDGSHSALAVTGTYALWCAARAGVDLDTALEGVLVGADGVYAARDGVSVTHADDDVPF